MLQGDYNRLSFTQESDFYGHKQFAERALFAGLPKAECFKHCSTNITVIVQGRLQLQLQTERFATKHASHDYFDDQSDVMIRLSHCVREMFTCYMGDVHLCQPCGCTTSFRQLLHQTSAARFEKACHSIRRRCVTSACLVVLACCVE